MPISAYLSDKWDAALYNWHLWMTMGGGDGGSTGISSIYDPSKWRRGTGRAPGFAVMNGDAETMDRMMLTIQQDTAADGPRVYLALVEWVKDSGTRGEQASRLGMSADTYRSVVDSGKVWLQRLHDGRAKIINPSTNRKTS